MKPFDVDYLKYYKKYGVFFVFALSLCDVFIYYAFELPFILRTLYLLHNQNHKKIMFCFCLHYL